MRAVDTSVLVRLLARDDEEQTAAAEAFISAGAWVSHVILVETLQDPEFVERALAHFRKRPFPRPTSCPIMWIM